MVQQQTIGRGKVYLAPMPNLNTPGTDFRFVGNTTNFKFNVESIVKEHFDSTVGIRVKDQSVTLGIDYKLEMVTDNIDVDNVAMFFSNTKGSLAQGSVASAVETLTSITAERSYQLGVSSGAQSGIMGIDPTGFLVQVNPLGANLVVDVDYVMDYDSGMIHFLAGSTLATTGASIDVTFAVLATSRDVVISGQSQVLASVKYIADNPIGENRNWYIPKALLSPTGDYVLQSSSEDWQEITFGLEALKLDGYNIAEANGMPV